MQRDIKNHKKIREKYEERLFEKINIRSAQAAIKSV